jgi:hypothetical protein
MIYRDEAETRARTREAKRLAGLERERQNLLATIESPEGDIPSLLRWKIYVPFAIAATVFLLDGDPVFAGITVLLAFVSRWIGGKVVAANRRDARRHLALVEAEIARLC